MMGGWSRSGKQSEQQVHLLAVPALSLENVMSRKKKLRHFLSVTEALKCLAREHAAVQCSELPAPPLRYRLCAR